MSPSRLTWRTWVAAGVLATVLFGTIYYRDNFSPRARARQVAAGFWQAVTAGDEAEVGRLLAPESRQTVAELVSFFRGYRAGEPGSLIVNDAAEAYQSYGLRYEVISGAVGPDGYTHSYVVGLKQLSSGELAVLFVGSGYSIGPEGRIVPVLQSYGDLDPGKVFTEYRRKAPGFQPWGYQVCSGPSLSNHFKWCSLHYYPGAGYNGGGSAASGSSEANGGTRDAQDLQISP